MFYTGIYIPVKRIPDRFYSRYFLLLINYITSSGNEEKVLDINNLE